VVSPSSVAVSGAQEALRRRQAALARRIAEGRGEGRARRRLARKARMAERTAAERARHDERRRLVQVISVRSAVAICICVAF